MKSTITAVLLFALLCPLARAACPTPQVAQSYYFVPYVPLGTVATGTWIGKGVPGYYPGIENCPAVAPPWPSLAATPKIGTVRPIPILRQSAADHTARNLAITATATAVGTVAIEYLIKRLRRHHAPRS